MKHLVTISLLLAALGLAPPAHAFTGVCADREATKRLLAQRYDEQQVASGVTRSGGLFELFADRTGANWSVLLTRPNGLTCIVALGSDLVAEAVPVKEPVTSPEM